jgi:hypothetical protein
MEAEGPVSRPEEIWMTSLILKKFEEASVKEQRH